MRPLKKVEVKRLFERAARDYPPRVELAFLLQSLEDPLNVGSMFRIAAACGALELVFSGPTPPPPPEAFSPPTLPRSDDDDAGRDLTPAVVKGAIFMKRCRRRPGPPNFFLSRQKRHSPQSSSR